MSEGDCGAGALSNALTEELMAGVDYTIPTPDLSGSDFVIPDDDEENPIYGSVVRLTNADLTEQKINGEGTFDVLMGAFKAHLAKEYDAGRITGELYSKTYIELTTAAMGNAVQYLLARDQSYWAAIQAQQQARLTQVQVVAARVNLETAKVQMALAQFQTLTTQSEYALSKLKLSGESINYCIQQYQLSDILPAQKEQLVKQGELITAQIEQSEAQIDLVREQKETARAQTSDTRTNGDPVTGMLGKQKSLYDQQITSYKRDAEVKAAKMYLDAWITQKTIDEGLLAPTAFTNVTIDEVMASVKDNNDL
jgi:hypothetical protein